MTSRPTGRGFLCCALSSVCALILQAGVASGVGRMLEILPIKIQNAGVTQDADGQDEMRVKGQINFRSQAPHPHLYDTLAEKTVLSKGSTANVIGARKLKVPKDNAAWFALEEGDTVMSDKADGFFVVAPRVVNKMIQSVEDHPHELKEFQLQYAFQIGMWANLNAILDSSMVESFLCINIKDALCLVPALSTLCDKIDKVLERIDQIIAVADIAKELEIKKISKDLGVAVEEVNHIKQVRESFDNFIEICPREVFAWMKSLPRFEHFDEKVTYVVTFNVTSTTVQEACPGGEKIERNCNHPILGDTCTPFNGVCKDGDCICEQGYRFRMYKNSEALELVTDAAWHLQEPVCELCEAPQCSGFGFTGGKCNFFDCDKSRNSVCTSELDTPCIWNTDENLCGEGAEDYSRRAFSHNCMCPFGKYHEDGVCYDCTFEDDWSIDVSGSRTCQDDLALFRVCVQSLVFSIVANLF